MVEQRPITRDDDKVWKIITTIASTILLTSVSAIFRGFVLTKLWVWFVVPFGVMQISLIHGIGISIIIGFLTYQQNAASGGNKDRDDTAAMVMVSTFIEGIMYVAFAWGIGAVVHSFM